MNRTTPQSPRVVTLALFYLAMAFVFAGELLVPGRSLFRWDTLIYTWPMVQEARAQILAGHWPFWASSFCCGTPLLENINAGVFYPMKLLVYFLPLKFGYQLFLFVHVWLTFLFMHLFLQRGLKLRPLAAVIGALAFGASGYMRSMWDTHNFYPLPWIPLALWIAVADTTARRRILAMAGCFVMLIYGGDLEQAILTVPAIMLLVLFRRNSTTDFADGTDVQIGSSPKSSKFISVFSVSSVVLLGILLGLLLSAPQLLPAWDWSQYSYRAAGMPLAEAAERSFHPARLIELIIPHFYGTRDGWFGDHLAFGEKKSPWCSSFHIGLVPFLLAMFAIVAALSERLRKKTALAEHGHILWALALFIGGVILAIGGFFPSFFKFWQSLPLVGSFRYPEKYLLWATLGLAALAAFGADFILGRAAWLTPPRRAEPARPTFRFPRLMLFALCFLSVLLPWYKELPTTNKFDPLETPQLLIPIINSDDPQGRIFVDPAVKEVPLPPYFASLRPSEKQAIYYREHLEFNSPRLWGCRTAGGFSPAEFSSTKTFRENITDGPQLDSFCRYVGVRWFVCAKEFKVPDTWEAHCAASWGQRGDIALLENSYLFRAERSQGTNSVTRFEPFLEYAGVASIWNPYSGFCRLDFTHRQSFSLFFESPARGWKDASQKGSGHFDIYFGLPTRTNWWADIRYKGEPRTLVPQSARMHYSPERWNCSMFIALAGLVVTLAIFIAGHFAKCTELPVIGKCCESILPIIGRGWPARSARGFVLRSATATLVCCLAFVVVSLAARSHWSCTFDEGFHLTRGLVLRHFHDARLSYFHPPLQNSLGGYFADLAFGDRLKYPVTDTLKRGDAITYAVEFAKANADVFNEAVRASRWAPMIFALLLIAVGVWWARQLGRAVWPTQPRFAGPASPTLAGWLAGIGLALNPTLLAHGNLNTTDMGVTALAVAGTALLWKANQSRSLVALLVATAVFALASVAKFTGLIWLGATLLVVVPLLAWRWKRAHLLVVIPFGLAAFAALLFYFYGSPHRFFEGMRAQTNHAFEGHKAWFHGKSFEQSSWWNLPAAVFIKAPEVWTVGVVLATCVFLAALIKEVRGQRAEVRDQNPGFRFQVSGFLIPFLPALVFALLLFFVNKMAIGVRHALPLIALGTIFAAVGIVRIASDRWRKIAAVIFAGGMIFSAVVSFPNFIGYFPGWAGGVQNGFRWLVDSNYDWGQGLDELEENWAKLTEENGGQPPNLIYFGFEDARLTHKLRLGPASYCGYMDDRPRVDLNERLDRSKGLLVVSISAPPLKLCNLDFEVLRNAEFVRRIGTTFEVFRIK